MKKLFLIVLPATVTTITFAQEVRVWNYGGTLEVQIIDRCSWNIKRDFENNNYYSWVCYYAVLLNKEPTTWYDTDYFKSIDYPRPGSRKSRIMWTCIDEVIKKLGIRPGDSFMIEISVELGTGYEPRELPTQGYCMFHFEGQLLKNNEISGRIYEGTYEFFSFDW